MRTGRGLLLSLPTALRSSRRTLLKSYPFLSCWEDESHRQVQLARSPSISNPTSQMPPKADSDTPCLVNCKKILSNSHVFIAECNSLWLILFQNRGTPSDGGRTFREFQGLSFQSTTSVNAGVLSCRQRRY